MNLISAEHSSLGLRLLTDLMLSAFLAFVAFAVQGVPADPLLLQGGLELLLASVFVALPVVRSITFSCVTILDSAPVIVPQTLTRQRLLPLLS